MATLELYSYFRSSAAYRVRIALQLKKLPYTYRAVHLINGGGEQNRPEYHAVNPMGEVPTLIDGDFALGQSMAIIMYLDQKYPEPALFPMDPKLRARVIQLCEVINSGIHPVQNLKVLQELEKRFGTDQSGKEGWARHWIERGFSGLETLLSQTAGSYSVGGAVTAADLFIVPQVLNARRYQCDLAPFPTLRAVEEQCLKLEAFRLADPAHQPDSP